MTKAITFDQNSQREPVMKSKDTKTAQLKATSPVVVPFCKNASARNGPTAEATARWMSECRVVGRDTFRRKEDASDQRVSDLMSRLYFDAKCGHAGAEYNLEREGVIAMIFGHVAGQMRYGDNSWEDTRWMVTELGKLTSMAQLERIILRDPPLDVALRDAEEEACDVADDCGGCEPDDPNLLMHEHILAHLRDRVERIRAAPAQLDFESLWGGYE
jgi:hypothetical protein